MASFQARQRDPLLHQSTQAMLERRGRELLGLALILVAVPRAVVVSGRRVDLAGGDVDGREVVDADRRAVEGDHLVGERNRDVLGQLRNIDTAERHEHRVHDERGGDLRQHDGGRDHGGPTGTVVVARTVVARGCLMRAGHSMSPGTSVPAS